MKTPVAARTTSAVMSTNPTALERNEVPGAPRVPRVPSVMGAGVTASEAGR